LPDSATHSVMENSSSTQPPASYATERLRRLVAGAVSPRLGVYAKQPFGGPEHVLRYLGAYTHRVASSNSRLVALFEHNVTFRWSDSAHGKRKRLMTLAVDEFLRRFLLHLLPPGFVRIHNFGFLANRHRAALLPLCFRLLVGSAGGPGPSHLGTGD
jgi:hypothetical protein